MDLAQFPARLATGAYIAHSGWDKWRADEATAEGVHAMAAGTYPVVKTVPPARSLRLLAAGEMAQHHRHDPGLRSPPDLGDPPRLSWPCSSPLSTRRR